MAVAGLSTIGATFSYGVESTAGTKPTTFTELSRINQIGGISIDTEQIDASALKDAITRYIAGRGDTGGTFNVTVNLTDDTEKEWGDLIKAYKALTGGKAMWFQTTIKGLAKAFFVVAQPPDKIPQSEVGQNELATVEMPLVIEDYKGLDTKVEPTPGE